jgi:hypothetical protein
MMMMMMMMDCFPHGTLMNVLNPVVWGFIGML